MEVMDKKKVELVLTHDKNDSRDINVSIEHIMETLLEGKFIIAITVVISLLLASIGGLFMEQRLQTFKGSASMIISFNFEGIEKGLDPFGNGFDITKIKAPAVLDKVVKNLELASKGINADILRTNIKLIPVIPGNITEQIKAQEEAKQQNIKEPTVNEYYPNVYIVKLNIPKTFYIDDVQAREVLDEIFVRYQDYFYYTYNNGSTLASALGPIDYDRYDYFQSVEVISNQISIIKNYLSAKSKEKGAKDFKSKKTGFTFNDILNSFEIIEKVDLQRLDALIGAYNLTKNKGELIKLYEYRLEKSELTSNKKADEAKIYTDTINKYKKDENIYVISGTQGEAESSIDTNKTSKYYDELIDKSTSAGVTAQDAKHDANYYKEQINKLKNDTVEQPKKQLAEKEVKTALPDIKTKLIKYIEITNDTVQEFYKSELFDRAITKISPAEYTKTRTKYNLYMALSLVAGLVLGVLITFIRKFLRNIRKQPQPNEQLSE